MMSGRKSAAAPSMMLSVSLLEDASHTVRLMPGSLDETSRNGNRAAPAAAMVNGGTSMLHRNARKGRARLAAARQAAKTATTGRIQSQGCAAALANQAPGTIATVLSSGLDTPFGSTRLVMRGPSILTSQKP